VKSVLNPYGLKRKSVVHGFGMPKLPFDPAQGRYLPLGAGAVEIRVATVLWIGEDFLAVSGLNVAMPFLLRKAPFDGLTVNGVSYVYSATYSTDRTRTATAGAVTEDQIVTPSYYAGEEIVIAKLAAQFYVGKAAFEWIDLNVSGRTWAMVEA
jgi:hypothetical protein